MGLVNRLISLSLSVLLAALQIGPAYAQSNPDIQAPVIELEAIAEASAGDTQVFTAQVADDRTLKDVTLYHRREGQTPFIAVPMIAIGDSTYYSATVESKHGDLRAFEYYIQARDESGNRTVEGYAFDPYKRELIAAETSTTSAIASSTPTISNEPVDSTTKKVKWWHIALGVVALGALASAGGSGSSGGSGEQTTTVPLTINIAQPGS